MLLLALSHVGHVALNLKTHAVLFARGASTAAANAAALCIKKDALGEGNLSGYQTDK